MPKNLLRVLPHIAFAQGLICGRRRPTPISRYITIPTGRQSPVGVRNRSHKEFLCKAPAPGERQGRRPAGPSHGRPNLDDATDVLIALSWRVASPWTDRQRSFHSRSQTARSFALPESGLACVARRADFVRAPPPWHVGHHPEASHLGHGDDWPRKLAASKHP
jgi:hypothetical protein